MNEKGIVARRFLPSCKVTFYFIVYSLEFVEAGFKFFTIFCKLKTTNLTLKKELSHRDSSFLAVSG